MKFVRVCKYYPTNVYQFVIMEKEGRKEYCISEWIPGQLPGDTLSNKWGPLRERMEQFGVKVPSLKELKFKGGYGHDKYAEFYEDGRIKD